jgi:hypothetical protein
VRAIAYLFAFATILFAADVASADTTVTQLSVGFQAGGKAYSEIVFFEDKRALDEFESGSFELGASVSAIHHGRRLRQRRNFGSNVRSERREERCHHGELRLPEGNCSVHHRQGWTDVCGHRRGSEIHLHAPLKRGVGFESRQPTRIE